MTSRSVESLSLCVCVCVFSVVAVIVNSYCTLALRIAAHLTEVWDAIDPTLPDSPHPLRVYLHEVTREAAPYLNSMAEAGITIEVGPTPNGLLRADAVSTTERALQLILRYLERAAAGQAPAAPRSLRVFADQGKVAWPEAAPGSKLPGALIAPSLQDRDFEPLRTGEPMFIKPDGGVVRYDGAHGPVVYPVFVNEAAYYYAQSGRGVGLTTLVDWPLT